ncbi:hypothetical protein CEXT_442451 [Caerostris extrusa]|uniref:Uncharacterized protein n=1 Tax=Caerostris extrusa TaxID=172846 RepID=A0AAV4WZN9_CAEEX|nr:hypothetical protein CEXT_442451 [Caerostris extrusa]
MNLPMIPKTRVSQWLSDLLSFLKMTAWEITLQTNAGIQFKESWRGKAAASRAISAFISSAVRSFFGRIPSVALLSPRRHLAPRTPVTSTLFHLRMSAGESGSFCEGSGTNCGNA